MKPETVTTPQKGVYDLKLGEVAFIGPYEFTRVPGGWLTITVRGMAFVPFNNDLQPQGALHEAIPF